MRVCRIVRRCKDWQEAPAFRGFLYFQSEFRLGAAGAMATLA
jgi:hypothetical protein